MTRLIVALIGPHGSGKTSVRSVIEGRGLPTECEIGNEIRNRVADSVTATQPQFDEVVARLEGKRDVDHQNSEVRVVESWHVGNIGFSRVRGARHASERSGEYLASALYATESVKVVQLTIDDDEFLRRNSEQATEAIESLRFYRRLEDEWNEMRRTLGSQFAKWTRFEPGVDPLTIAQHVLVEVSS